MSISYNHQISQDKSTDYGKIQASEGVPLDLYAIFSRSALFEAKSDMATYKRRKIERRSYRLRLREVHKAKEKLKRGRVCLNIHKNMIRVQVESAIQGLSAGGGKRSNVAGFSNRSRKRMIDLMNSQRHGAPEVFVSLTYADEALFSVSDNDTVIRVSTSKDWKNDLEVLRKRFERAYPNIKAIWRIELKKRKSGDFRGMIAPHFHLVLWKDDSVYIPEDETYTDVVGKWLQKNWFEIVNSGNDDHWEHGTHVSTIKSARHAMFYVSKYVAKTEDEFEDNYEIGRRWGRLGQFDTSVSMQVNLSEKEYVEFRRLLRGWLKSKSRGYAKRIAKISLDKGFTVYGIGDNQMVGNLDLNCDFIMKLILHACDMVGVVSIPIG